jgi:hypothetical protein
MTYYPSLLDHYHRWKILISLEPQHWLKGKNPKHGIFGLSLRMISPSVKINPVIHGE